MRDDQTSSTSLKGAKVEKPELAVETPPEPVSTESPTMKAIRNWVSKRVHGSPISRNTEAYNYLMEQLPELASMIDKENKA